MQGSEESTRRAEANRAENLGQALISSQVKEDPVGPGRHAGSGLGFSFSRLYLGSHQAWARGGGPLSQPVLSPPSHSVCPFPTDHTAEN